MITIDELRKMTTIDLVDVALAMDDEPSFWIIAGMLTSKLMGLGFKDEATEIWNLGHRDPSAVAEARSYLANLKNQILLS
jgi:hypothetical protein